MGADAADAWPQGSAGRRPHATARRALLLVAVLLAVLVPGRATRADERPDAAAAARAAMILRGWLADFDLPDLDAPEARVPLPGAQGACVILRARGRVVAHAAVLLEPGDDPDLLLRRTAGRCFAAALGDRVIAGLRETVGDEFGSRLTYELELAGALAPLPGRTFESVVAQLEPGLDGLALLAESGRAAAFPAVLRAEGVAAVPARALPPLLVELGLPVAEYPELRRSARLRASRFRTVHLVQEGPGAPPDVRFRGEKVVPSAAVDRDRVAELANDVFNHLVSHVWGGAGWYGVHGDYDPAVDRYEPMFAPAREQALVAFAFARLAGARGLETGLAERGRLGACEVLGQLALVEPDERTPTDDPLAAAAVVLADLALDEPAAEDLGLELPPGAEDPWQALRAEARDVVIALAAALAATGDDDDVVTSLSPHDASVIALAALRLSAADPARRLAPAELASLVDATWARVPAPDAISLMPWMAMVARDLGRTAGPVRVADRTEAFRALRAALARTQIGAGRDGPPDLAGGFLLLAGEHVLAGAQSVRPLSMLAVIGGMPSITPPADRPASDAMLLRGVRFVDQLVVGFEDRWSVPAPHKAIGGLRATTWDARMPLAAQAIALVALVECVETLDGR